MTEMELLHQINNSYQKILSENLVGFYVHGSIAFHCFHWSRSDIDFVVVVNQAPSLEEKKALTAVLLKLDPLCPPHGLEMSVVLESVCRNFQYPVPFELHYSNMHKEKCIADLTQYCLSMNGLDKDLAAHFTVIRKTGITLYGKDISQVFGAVPKSDYMDSIKSDIEDALKEIDKKPVYIILNLCRVLAYVKDDVILSKEQGGAWGMENLPEVYHLIIENAFNSYCNNALFQASDEARHHFAQFMIHQIFRG